jgi:very-short-patch-repair endonuclease
MSEIPRMNLLKFRDRRRKLRTNNTKAEQVLWGRLRRKQLGVTFSRQIGIENFIPDFCCRSRKKKS